MFRDHRFILFIGLSTAVYTLGGGAVFFLLPLLVSKLSDNLLLVGFMVALPSLSSLFFDIPTGELADCVGRKRLIVCGLFGMLLFSAFLPLASSIPSLFVLLLLLGFFNQLINVPVRSYVMDIAPKDKSSEYFGLLVTGMQLGFAVGPIIGGLLLSGNFSGGVCLISLLYAVTSVVSMLLVWFGVPETVKEKKGLVCGIKSVVTKDKIFMKGLLEYRALKSAGLLIFLLTLAFIVTDGVIWAIEPLYNDLGIGSETVGVILSMFVIPFVLFQIPAGILADRVGKTKVLIAGLLLAGSFFILFGLTRDVYLMMFSAFAATTGLALAIPAADGLLTDASTGKDKGCVVGVWDTAEDLGYLIGPILGGLIAEAYSDITLPFIFLGAMLLILIIPAYYLPRKPSSYAVIQSRVETGKQE